MAMKAVAGRPEDQTPMLHSNISDIVLNPPWHVPDTIARKEIWPKAHKDKGYLARNQYHVIDGRLIQKAGPKSALGRFKFNFPNGFDVYLHDTPAQAGFSRTSRLASHGCVRLEQPKALAQPAAGRRFTLDGGTDRHDHRGRRHSARAPGPGRAGLHPVLDGVRR